MSKIRFTLISALLSGLIMLGNHTLLSYALGYGAIYSGMLLLFFIMYALMKTYARYFKAEMAFWASLPIGLAVFALAVTITFVGADQLHKLGSSHSYAWYRHGYGFHVLEETSKVFLPITGFFVLVFAPVYRLLRWRLSAGD